MNSAERIRDLYRQAKSQQLVILVWGPGQPSPGAVGDPLLYWNKRVQIRDVLSREFPNSEVLFSEHAALRDYTRDLEDLLTEELVHAAVADCILVLDVSRGAHVEVDRFSEKPSIAANMRILIPERFVGTTGLVGSVHQDLRVKGFSDDELTRCVVATEMVVKIVLSFAIRKLMPSRF